MRCAAEKALKSKAGSTQRVWEGYAELIAVALVNATITTDATATKSLSRSADILLTKRKSVLTEQFVKIIAHVLRYALNVHGIL